MKEELRKSLTDLIDETLLELEELKKSRYSASEIKIEGPGDGIAGKPSNGDLHAKAEDKKCPKCGKEPCECKEESDKDDAKKAEGKNEDAAKAEGKNEDAAKAEDDKKDKDKDKDEPHKDDPKHEEKEKELGKKLLDMHKSETPAPAGKSDAEFETLMKGLVDERVKPLEDKLSTILSLVNKIAEQPVPAKGVTANAVPLRKSNEEGTETLSKSDVASKLFELKKSGTKVDSLDITRAEMGHDLNKIIEKYKIS